MTCCRRVQTVASAPQSDHFRHWHQAQSCTTHARTRRMCDSQTFITLGFSLLESTYPGCAAWIRGLRQCPPAALGMQSLHASKRCCAHATSFRKRTEARYRLASVHVTLRPVHQRSLRQVCPMSPPLLAACLRSRMSGLLQDTVAAICLKTVTWWCVCRVVSPQSGSAASFLQCVATGGNATGIPVCRLGGDNTDCDPRHIDQGTQLRSTLNGFQIEHHCVHFAGTACRARSSTGSQLSSRATGESACDLQDAA